jgi:hypothetical protein
MNELSRRDFLKLSSVFGIAALLPFRQRFGVAKEKEQPIASVLTETEATATDEIMQDLTRVLMWIDGKAILGIVEAQLTLRPPFGARAYGLPWGHELYLRETKLECVWLGYPDRYREFAGFFKVGEVIEIEMAVPQMDDVLYHEMAQVWECRESMCGWPPAWLRLKAKTLAEFHKLMEARIVFKGAGDWYVELFEQGIKRMVNLEGVFEEAR